MPRPSPYHHMAVKRNERNASDWGLKHHISDFNVKPWLSGVSQALRFSSCARRQHFSDGHGNGDGRYQTLNRCAPTSSSLDMWRGCGVQSQGPRALQRVTTWHRFKEKASFDPVRRDKDIVSPRDGTKRVTSSPEIASVTGRASDARLPMSGHRLRGRVLATHCCGRPVW